MAQQIKAFVFEPKSLSLIPRVHMVEGGNQLLQLPLTSGIHASVHQYTNKEIQF